MKITAIREHEICAGHRVCGHENKCSQLHGHGYVITFHCAAPELDRLGRVIDFGVIKTTLCQWLEDMWDHKFILWADDPLRRPLTKASPDSICIVPFNPTAENMAAYLLNVVGPLVLADTAVKLVRVEVRETRKCSAVAEAS